MCGGLSTPTTAMLSPSSRARDPETGHGPAELVTTGSPKLLLAWGKPPTDVERWGQQDLPYWLGP